MFRQILKLNRASKAYREGRYREALELAEDPEIREHLKAEEIRKASLRALDDRAARRQKRGDLTLASQDLREIVQRAPDSDAAGRERSLRDMKLDRDEARNRLRARYFHAKLEVERGDLLAAKGVLDEVDPSLRSDAMTDLGRDIARRIDAAQDEIATARRTLGGDPSMTEQALVRARTMHRRAEGLREAWVELARTRSRDLARSKAADAELVDRLVEYGLFKRRYLEGLTPEEAEALDQDLNAAIRKRVLARVDEGRVREARLLLERQRENLPEDAAGREVGAGVEALARAEESLRTGDFDVVEAALTEARARLGRVRPVRDAKKELGRRRKLIEPAVAETERLIEEGELLGAKRRLLEALDHAPGDRGCTGLLKLVNGKLADQRARLARVRQCAEAGELTTARELLEGLRGEGCRLAEISLLWREIGLLQVNEPERPSRVAAEPEPAPAPVSSVLGPTGAIGSSWLLSVEEYGEVLVHEGETIVIGNAVARLADLPILASIAARHAAIHRKISFHGGVSYRLEALENRPVLVNDRKIESVDLADGDHVRLGRDLTFVFRYPCARSRAALLQLPGAYSVEGTHQIILMPPCGRAGSLVVGNTPEAHVPTPDHSGVFEIFRDRETSPDVLTVQGPSGVGVDGDEPRARGPCYHGSYLIADEVRASLRSIRLT